MLSKKLKEVLGILGGQAILAEDNQLYILTTIEKFKKNNHQRIESLTKQELIDKINNDIASWKAKQKEKEIKEIDLSNFEKEENLNQDIRQEIRYEQLD